MNAVVICLSSTVVLLSFLLASVYAGMHHCILMQSWFSAGRGCVCGKMSRGRKDSTRLQRPR